MIEWLLQSVDPDRVHQVGFLVSWHGRLMVLAWGFFIPIGVIAARFFKVLPRQNWPAELDNQLWWHGHRVLQLLAVVLMCLGIIFIVLQPVIFVGVSFHTRVGWFVLVLALIQVASGFLRGTKGGPTALSEDGSLRGDHYDMTRRRVIFECFHKVVGYILLVSASYCIVTGMWVANAPNWMWLSIGFWWLIVLGVSVVLQLKGACFDTYKAIWGNAPSLPGNGRKPIGLGIKNTLPWSNDHRLK